MTISTTNEEDYLKLKEKTRDNIIKSLKLYIICVEEMAEEDREFAKKEIASIRQLIKELEELTYVVIRPTTISQAKLEISNITGAPANIIEIEIDHATPIYTQYSLLNRFEVYDNATHKERVADFYRFPTRTL